MYMYMYVYSDLKRFTVQNHYCTKLSSNVEVPSTLTVEEIAADRGIGNAKDHLIVAYFRISEFISL